MVILYPKGLKNSKKDSILENDQKGFVNLSDHCALLTNNSNLTHHSVILDKFNAHFLNWY